MKNLLTKVLYVSALCFVINQGTLAQQKKSSTAVLEYGYGPADAPVVAVGNQTWLGKNLNVDRFANGDTIPEARDEWDWKFADENRQPAWCYYNNDPANGRTYGRLYNWYAVNDPRGLAPQGWHIPSDAEWTAMTDYLRGKETAGLKMKSISGWNENGNGNNDSGFAGLPGGNRFANGFYGLVKYGNWWSSSDGGTSFAYYRYLSYDNVKVGRGNNYNSIGYSVRCLRD